VGPRLVGLCTVGASLLLINNQRIQNNRQNEANARQFALLKSKEERDEIIRKLNLFYGPFKELRTQSKILYEKFVLQRKSSPFRTLKHLLDGNRFVCQRSLKIDPFLTI
jgi:hypothetical protein